MQNILPLPESIIEFNRFQQFKGATDVYCPISEVSLAQLLIDDIGKVFNLFCGKIIATDTSEELAENSTGGIYFINDKSLSVEEYNLEIKAGKILISASTHAGYYYGCASLLQLFPTPRLNDITTLPQLSITDAPKYQWRGLLFDEARHFFGKTEVKRILDILSKLKINKFHWHLTDDQGFRIQLDCYPQLTDIGATRQDTQVGGFYSKNLSGKAYTGYYSKDDIREVIEYASLRAIEIIPEIDLPGHTTAMIAALPILHKDEIIMPVATTFGNKNNLICVSKTQVFDVLDNILTEVSQLFPGKYIHLGGNDVNFDTWDTCPRCKQYMQDKNLNTYRELLGDFFNRVNSIVKKLGKTAIIYSSGYSSLLDKDIILQYNSVNQLSETVSEYYNGRKIILSPPSTYYFDYPNAFLSINKVYKSSMPPIEFSHDSGNILGLEAALWTEWVYDNEKIDVALFPRMHAVAEKSWSKNYSSNGFKSFIKRLQSLEDNMTRNNITYYRNYSHKPSLFKRLGVRWQYIHNDQYREVQQNRK